MLKTSVPIGKNKYWLGERCLADTLALDAFQKENANSEEPENVAIVTNIRLVSHYFKSHYKTVPFWKVFEKIRYKFLSNSRYLLKIMPSHIPLFLTAGLHLEKQVKKKMSRTSS